MSILADVALALRIKSTSYNDEIQDLIDGATADLLLSGILQSKIDTLETDEPDILIKRCIILYNKANFGLDNQDSAKFEASYESLKIHLMLSAEYTEEVV
jgi:hypothetical protein